MMPWKTRARHAVWRMRNASRVLDYHLSPPADETPLRELAKTLRAEGIVASSADELCARSGSALIDQVVGEAHRIWDDAKHGSAPQGVDRADAYAAAGKDYRNSLLPEALPIDSPFVRLALDPSVLNIAQRYLGMRPLLRDIGLWWDRPTEGPAKETQLWHQDGDDVLNVKLFMYFTDVDREGGPFCFIPGTHPLGHQHPLSLERDGHGRSTDEQMRRVIPESAWRVCTGAAKTMIFCDTCGYHKGLKPSRHERLMLVAHYTSGAPRYPQRLRVSGASAVALSRIQQRALGNV